jgi:CDP-6-deoxy-D-xylo-4-hexulose-3-dehydrase
MAKKTNQIKLVNDTVSKNDIDYLVEWLKTYPRLTKGPITRKLEEKFAKKMGSKYSVFCNSGSSANLLMLQCILENKLVSKNSKVVVPALAWATDYSPVVQLGYQPILCDINLQNLSIDLDHFEQICIKDKPSALILVSVLGLVPDMSKILNLCKKYGVILIEDNCESLGSSFSGKLLGNFGLMSSFSTYFGHHISTIEGGFITTNDKDAYNTLLMIRNHGWDRDLDNDSQEKLRKKWGIDSFNSLYTFYLNGFNCRSTDLQAYIGLKQIDKIDSIIKERNKNFFYYLNNIKGNMLDIDVRDDCFISNFAYPILSEKKSEIVRALMNKNVEVRPLISGSIGNQPFYRKDFGRLELPNVNLVDKFGFYIPNHPDLDESDIIFISKIINGENL